VITPTDPTDPTEMAAFNKNVVDEFRAYDGKVDGVFEEGTMALLHHAGARSGVERVTPLGYFTDGDRIFVVASFGGSDVNPAWYGNLLANPRTTVEIGSETIPVTARAANRCRTRRALREDSRDHPDVRRLSTKDRPRHPRHRARSGLTGPLLRPARPSFLRRGDVSLVERALGGSLLGCACRCSCTAATVGRRVGLAHRQRCG
jgi:deazaflavin-dependent oxidoreductase (nitroreductase family)